MGRREKLIAIYIDALKGHRPCQPPTAADNPFCNLQMVLRLFHPPKTPAKRLFHYTVFWAGETTQLKQPKQPRNSFETRVKQPETMQPGRAKQPQQSPIRDCVGFRAPPTERKRPAKERKKVRREPAAAPSPLQSLFPSTTELVVGHGPLLQQ
jgi:hypothetical protein